METDLLTARPARNAAHSVAGGERKEHKADNSENLHSEIINLKCLIRLYPRDPR